MENLKASVTLICGLLVLAPACVDQQDDPDDGIDEPFPAGKGDGLTVEEGTPEALAILRLVNNASIAVLDVDAQLSRTAANKITAYRAGADGLAGSADDRVFETLAQLDAVPYVGPITLDHLRAFAVAHWLPAWNHATERRSITVPVLSSTCFSKDIDPAGDRCSAGTPTTFHGMFRIWPATPNEGWEAGVYMPNCRGEIVAHTGAFRMTCGDSFCTDRRCTTMDHTITGTIQDRLVIDSFQGQNRSGNQALGWTSSRWTLEAPMSIEL